MLEIMGELDRVWFHLNIDIFQDNLFNQNHSSLVIVILSSVGSTKFVTCKCKHVTYARRNSAPIFQLLAELKMAFSRFSYISSQVIRGRWTQHG